MAASPPPAPFEISPLGDTALLIRVGTRIDEDTRRTILGLAQALAAAPLPAVLDLVPGYTTLAVHYDVVRAAAGANGGRTPFEAMRAAVQAVTVTAAPADDAAARTVEVPVCYGDEYGPDLADVAAHTGLPADVVVRTHAAGAYRVHLLGFLPGFPYLAGLDPRLATPRRATPRTRVPAGSVGIAGGQTGIYSLESPGGWQLIGRTPSVLFDPAADPPTLLAAGDQVRFRAITREEFDHLAAGRG